MSNKVDVESVSRNRPAAGGLETTVLKPIRLTDQVAVVLKEQIFSGALRPGERVVEQKFARQFGVGQNAIREALIELAHLGFVRRVPNKGTYVTEITPENGIKIARVRRAMEGLVIDLIMERMQTETLDLDTGYELLARMRQHLKRGEMEAFYACDIEFHRTLWQLADNEFLSQMLETIVVPLFAFFIVVNMHPSEKMHSILEAVAAHERILDAIRSGSAEKAQARMGDLLDLSLRFCSGESVPRRKSSR